MTCLWGVVLTVGFAWTSAVPKDDLFFALSPATSANIFENFFDSIIWIQTYICNLVF